MKKILFLNLILLSGILLAQQDNIYNRFLMAKSFEQTGDYEKAKNIYEEVYNKQPSNFEYFKALNNIYLQIKDYQSSINLIETKIKTSPPNIDLYGMLGSTYYLMGNEQKAFESWESAFNNLPQNEFNYRYMANIAIERRAFGKAIEFLQRGKEIAKEPRLFSLDLANIYSITMNYEKAAEEYCELLRNDPKTFNVVDARIKGYINKPDALGKTISVFEDCASDDNYFVKKIFGDLLIQNKSYTKAFETYKKLDEISPNNTPGNELLLFANTVLNAGAYEAAVNAYNELLDNYSDSPIIPAVKLGLANALGSKLKNDINKQIDSWKPYYKIENIDEDKVEAVINSYRDIIKEYPNTNVDEEAYYKIAMLKFHYENNLTVAQEYLKKIIERYNSFGYTIPALIKLGEIAVRKGNLKEAENIFKTVIKDARTSIDNKNEANFKLAKVLFYQGNFEQSSKISKELLKNLQDNNANDAIELSMLMNTKMNDSTSLATYAKAELLAEQNHFENAISEYEKIASNKNAFILSKIADYKLALMNLAINNYETSIEILSTIADEEKQNIYADKALYLLGKIYQFGIGNNQKALEIYEKLLAKYPNSLYLDEAREEILKLRNKTS